MSRSEDGTLHCDMSFACKEEVTMLEDKGWVYCTSHGIMRRMDQRRVRKLRSHELNRLRAGKPLTKY